METKKTPWQAPELEVLDVMLWLAMDSGKLIGSNKKHLDADLYDPSS